MDKIITANIVDVKFNDMYPAEIHIEDGYITDVIPIVASHPEDIDFDYDGILLPGFIDGHIHIESTMLTPSNFACAAVQHGTTSVVADPHEIANVSGVKGINFMINNGKEVPFDFYYSAPSCVPATDYETSGAIIDSDLIEMILNLDEVVCLGEMMNFPGVLADDEEVLKKIEAAKKLNKPVDGHAPLLSGEDLKKYISAGISTDHESSSFDEAIEKKELGMKIMVREGSSAKNFDDILNKNDRQIYLMNAKDSDEIPSEDLETLMKSPIFDMLISDDKNSKDLEKGHLEVLIKRLIDFDVFPIEAIKMVTVNPAQHYNLDSGSIEPGKKANFVLIDNFENFNVLKTFVAGELVYDEGKVLFEPVNGELENTFNLEEVKPEDFDLYYEVEKKSDNPIEQLTAAPSKVRVRVMKVLDGSLITDKTVKELEVVDNIVQPNIDRDILKIAVVNRYGGNTVANAFVKGFSIKNAAIASSVAHDSHNIIVVGTNNKNMADAVNLIREHQGGIAVVSRRNGIKEILELPIAGLMCNDSVETVALKLRSLQNIVKLLGCQLKAPFMTMSFLALLVIPALKISDRGLFDSDNFEPVDVVIGEVSDDE